MNARKLWLNWKWGQMCLQEMKQESNENSLEDEGVK